MTSNDSPKSLALLDIGDVARRSGFTASTLRYYEELGLIQSSGRKGLRRLFGPQTLVQLSLITLAKTAGFSLEEITAMMGPDGQLMRNRKELHARADQLDQQIKHLSGLRDMLRHTADCPYPEALECPNFLRLLDVATRRQRRSKPQ